MEVYYDEQIGALRMDSSDCAVAKPFSTNKVSLCRCVAKDYGRLIQGPGICPGQPDTAKPIA